MLDEQFFIRHLILQDRTTGDRSLSTRAVLPAAAKVRYHALDAVMYLTFDGGCGAQALREELVRGARLWVEARPGPEVEPRSRACV